MPQCLVVSHTRSSHGQFEVIEPADEDAGEPLPDVGGLDPGGLPQQDPQDDLGFQACQCRPDAKVCTLAEGDVPLGAATVEPKLLGLVELSGITVGGPGTPFGPDAPGITVGGVPGVPGV